MDDSNIGPASRSAPSCALKVSGTNQSGTVVKLKLKESGDGLVGKLKLKGAAGKAKGKVTFSQRTEGGIPQRASTRSGFSEGVRQDHVLPRRRSPHPWSRAHRRPAAR